jgi:hypothetical protein
VFTARYAHRPYITQICFVFKRLLSNEIFTEEGHDVITCNFSSSVKSPFMAFRTRAENKSWNIDHNYWPKICYIMLESSLGKRMCEVCEVMRRFFWNMKPCCIVDRFRHSWGKTSAALKRVAADCTENFVNDDLVTSYSLRDGGYVLMMIWNTNPGGRAV